MAKFQAHRIGRKVFPIASAALCLLLGSVSAEEPTSHGGSLISFQGIDDIIIGMPLETLERVDGRLLVQNDRTIAEEDLPLTACADVLFFRRVARAPQSSALVTSEMGLQTQSGKVTRVDLLGGPSVLKTIAGIGIGSSEGEVRHSYNQAWTGTVDAMSANDPVGAAYGRSTTRTAFFLRSPDRKRAMLIETDGVEVVSIHVGDDDVFKIDDASHSILVKPC